MTPEWALFYVLQAFFQGTSADSAFGTGIAMNGSQPVVDAPINYLQIWDTDILYAAGLGNCTTAQLMSQPPITGKPPACYQPITAKVHVPSLGGSLTAQDLLNVASYAILNYTQEPVTYPPFCGCTGGYVPRNAFLGDAVCVTKKEQMQAAADTTAAPTNSNGSYSTNYTAAPVSPYTVSIPYGICTPARFRSGTGGGVYRQAYMGDYVCVTSEQAMQVKNDNAAFRSRFEIYCPSGSSRLPSLPGPPGPLLGASLRP